MTSTPTFFHGTRAAFRGRGGLVLPGDQVGRDNHRIGRNSQVFVTTDVEVAEEFARVASGRGKPKVLTVLPIGTLTLDDYVAEEFDDFTCYSCEFAHVVTVRTLHGDTP